MKDNDSTEKDQELIDMDKNGNAISEDKNKEEKKSQGYKGLIIAIVIVALIDIGLVLFKKMSLSKKTNRILNKTKTVEEIYQKAGDLIISMVKSNPKIKIGLASGGTPKGLYKYLIQKYKNNEVNFKEATFYSLDEFCGLPKNHIQSYDYYMWSNFLSHVEVSKEKVHLIDGEGSQEKCEQNAKLYNDLLRSEPADVQILSFGGNGHFGFNEKGTPFDSVTHVVKLDEKTKKEKSKLFENNLAKTPSSSITQGIKNVLDAKTVIVIANGKGKAEGIKSLFGNNPTTDSPLSALINHPGKVYVFADEEACSLLNN